VALKKCKECGKDVSTKADSCPHCGAKIKRGNLGCGGILVLMIFFAIIASFFGSPDTKTKSPSKTKVTAPAKVKTPEELREERIKNCFSGWDGSHRELVKLIKKSMNDPGSYDHVETVYWDKGDHLVVKTTFRGKNAFGGVIKNWVMAKADLDCNIEEVISQGQ